jgi:peptidoglycan/LPS O-acetylase OafA/YrhL
MGRADEGLLEAGYWEPAKAENQAPRPSIAWNYTQYIVQCIRPSFLGKTSARTIKLRRTAYLDGLRGFAALLVYFHHHGLWAHESQNSDVILQSAYGYNKEYYFATLPFLRTFVTGGHLAVSVLFVLSGYVLSAKPLSLIHAGDHLGLSENLASALFRRWIRLYIPLICVTFTSFSLWHVFGILANFSPQSSFRAEVWQWYTEFKNFSFVFRTGGDPWLSYSFYAWSIPVEFRGSIVVYTCLLAFSRCTQKWRLRCTVGLIVYLMYIADGALLSMFLAGMLLCDLDLLALSNSLPSFLARLRPYKTYLSLPIFLLGVFLGGVPSWSWDVNYLHENPGWHWLGKLKPQACFDFKWFYLFLAAVCILSTTQHLPPLKRAFESRPALYLGRISFALYLVHGPVLWTLGDRLYAAVGMTREGHALGIPDWVGRFPLPWWGPYGFEVCYILPHVILLPVTLWIAEIVTVVCDEPAIRIAGWLWRKVTAPEVVIESLKL